MTVYIVYEPAAGVNNTWQYALTTTITTGDVLGGVGASVQLSEPNDPGVEAEKLTVPDGKVGKNAVSTTVAVQVVALPAVTTPGAHNTFVLVG